MCLNEQNIKKLKYLYTKVLHLINNDINLMFVCPYTVRIIVNDDQQDATILAYLFIPNQLYMFRVMSWPIIRST